MKKIAVASQKGGGGKTTSTINIGARLNMLGYSVLLVDLDPQGNLTTHAGFTSGEFEVTVKDLFDFYMPTSRLPQQPEAELALFSTAIKHIREGLDILPADTLLETVDNSLISVISREHILNRILQKITKLYKEYDYILIDCRPTLSTLVVNALTACDTVLIPVKAQYLDFVGFNQLCKSVELIKDTTNPNISIGGVFLTMYDGRITVNNDIAQAIHSIGVERTPVCTTKISQATALADAAMRGQDIFSYALEGNAADRKRAAKPVKEYTALVEELFS